MKLLVLSFLLTVSAFAEVCLEGRSASEDSAGNIQVRENCYMNVKNGLGSSIPKGNAVIFKAASEDGFTVTTSAVAGSAPVCVMMEACADAKVCKCQTYGYADFVDFDKVSQNAVAGNLVFISENNAGLVQAEAEGSYAASDVPMGQFLEAASATGDVKVWINLR